MSDNKKKFLGNYPSISFSIKKTLAKNKFNPVAQLVNNVYPQLDPEKQAEVLLELVKYIYSKPALPKQRAKKTQVNVQVNNQLPTAEQQKNPFHEDKAAAPSIKQLLEIAKGPKE